MPANRGPLFLVPDEEDQVPRLERFRSGHPEVIILLKGPMPTAYAGHRKIQRHTLRVLLDDLEQMFRPDAQTSQAGAPQ